MYFFDYRIFSSPCNKKRVLFWRPLLVGVFGNRHSRHGRRMVDTGSFLVVAVGRPCVQLVLEYLRIISTAQTRAQRLVSQKAGKINHLFFNWLCGESLRIAGHGIIGKQPFCFLLLCYFGKNYSWRKQRTRP
jgi:hypothetical protein